MELRIDNATRLTEKGGVAVVTLEGNIKMNNDIAEILDKISQGPLEVDEAFAIVTKRKPRRWHKVACRCHGPSDHWRTSCGDGFNGNTMVLQRWSEFVRSDKDVECDSCRR